METLIEKNIYESIIKVKGKKKLEVNEPSLNIKISDCFILSK